MDRPRLLIAGERSGTGKSTLTIGIIAALRSRGLAIQPFKAGPDFLDPMHHSQVACRPSRNLDTWMFPEWVPTSFQNASADADMSVIEGVMGLYDGLDGRSEEGSSAHLAKRLRCPVVLVLDASSTSRSVGAVAKGFKIFDPGVEVRGVIFNRVSNQRHLEMVEDAIEGLGLMSLGGMPKSKDVHLESRHLGLVPAEEEDNRGRYDSIRDMVKENLDLDGMLQIASEASEWPGVAAPPIERAGTFRLAVARDEAFNFYYEDNLDIMRSLGAEIVEFSPIRDELPDADGYYFGGGYPELHLDELSSNLWARRSLSARIEENIPVYAECGGLMYLCRKVKGEDGKTREMVGAFDAEVKMTSKLQALGYVEARCVNENLLSPAGGAIRGHVFHYSMVHSHKESQFSYQLSKSKGIDGAMDGMFKYNTLASYLHLHFGSNLDFARRFAGACVGRGASRRDG